VFAITYKALADSVEIEMIGPRPRLINYSQDLTLIGTGRSAYVFKIKEKALALKVYFPQKEQIAVEEATIYRKLQHIEYYPTLYDGGRNYIVIDFIEGHTLFQCLQKGIFVPEKKFKEISEALEMAKEVGLNPADIHLKNIILTSSEEVKVIDVARFMQQEKDNQWNDLERAYHKVYSKFYFPKKIPTFILNLISFIYKKRYLPKPIRVLFDPTE
jgi:predicted Ser/Thr protein kinase